MHYVGILIAVALIAGLAIFSGTRAKGGDSKGSGAGIAAGVIMGTLVGGSSTVGTAQLAYNFGLSAWWFTLGGGIACLILGLVYVKPLRAQGCPTLVGMIRKEYGPTAGLTASVLNAVGTFINILSQILAASAVVLVVWPTMGTIWTIIISAVFMVLYVVFGGTKGAGMVGVLKMVLLYISMVTCGILAISKMGGAGGTIDVFHQLTAETGTNYFSLFARGVGKDLGAGLSLILGVLTTQTYAQAVLTTTTTAKARTGAIISAFLIPPIGACGIVVGLFMRTVTDPATFVAKTALTQFTMDYLPPLVGGLILGTLFVASVGTGAGLALGISTMVNKDVVQRFTRKFDDPMKSSLLEKALIVIVLAAACLLSAGPFGDTILNFAFMSMGLRGAVVFAPLCFALWGKGRVSHKFALAAIIVGPVMVLLFGVLEPLKAMLNGIDSLFPGIIAAVIVMCIGMCFPPKELQGQPRD